VREVTRRRHQAEDLRTGRAWAKQVAKVPVPPGPTAAATYAMLTAHLDQLRAGLAGDRFADRPLSDVRRDHADLQRALAEAVAHAFAADAAGALTPAGVTSWAGEGLARSYEREMLMFASADDAPRGWCPTNTP